MIPVTLTMNAFGPFAREQVIDFTRLGKRKIFLITGETGAGKTTIYDAISFALYGSASSENRKSYTLKSHHAPETELCWVRYRFSLREQVYEIYRQPLQPGKKRDGSPKELGEKAELTMPDGEVITGKSAVNYHIESILGLSYSQFKQTIMLAQGEFRQLLEASSSQKQEIFSKIFGTEGYQALTDALSTRYTELGRQVQSEQQAIARVVRELGKLGFPALLDEDAQFLTYAAVAEALEGGLSLHRAKLEQLDEEIALLDKEKASIRLDEARERNEKLRRVAELEAAVSELEQQSPTMESRRRLLERLQAAKELREQEEIILSTKAGIETVDRRITQMEQQLGELKPRMDAALQEQQQLVSMRTQAQLYIAETAALREQEKQAAARERQQQAITEREQRLAARSRRLEELTRTAEALRLDEAVAAASRQLQALRDLQGNRQARLDLEPKITGAQEDYQRLYRAFIDGQAARLAENLVDGTPCPVCGSAHHPSPALPQGEDVIEPVVEQAKTALDKLLEARVSYKMEAKRIRDRICDLDISLPKPVTGEELDRLISQWDGHIQSLLPQRKTEIPPGLSLAEAEQAVNLERQAVEADREAVATMKGSLVQEQDALSHQEIQRRISQGEQQSRKLLDQVADLAQRAKALQSQQDRIVAELEATRKHREENSAQFSGLREQFIARLRSGGFAKYADYAEAAKGLDDIPVLTQVISLYDRKLGQAAAQLAALKPDVEGKAPVDLQAMTDRLEELTRRLEAMRENRTQVYSLLATADGRLRELSQLYEQSGELAKQYAIASDLATLARGSKGPGISFERYILASYFEDIIQIANIHLQRMTSSRYRLKRRSDKTRHGSSGLDMEVIDSYTGTQRSVSTLSGGEGFKASLALALGLSDVVQIYAGGVSIDTMFIDEGFGSLDEKSLDSAVQTLLSLETSGRMVGIISHVSQLRDAIETKLSVRYSPTGSAASFEGIN